jgi:hypothetical protein
MLYTEILNKRRHIKNGKQKGFNKYEVRGNITVIFIENRKGEKFETIVDTEDLAQLIELDYHWSLERSRFGAKANYASASVYQGYQNGKLLSNKTYKLHGVVMRAKPREVIDHINHEPLDNRKENLRIITIKDNSKNRNGANSNNKSGYRNVSLSKNEWVVQLQVEGKNTCLKRFPLDQLEEAGKFAAEMREKYYGKFKGCA